MEIIDFRKVKPKFISPTKVLMDLGLAVGESVVDYASGAGHWSLAAASIVGSTGSVLAIEDDIEMLGLLNSRAETQHLRNIDTEEIDLVVGTSKKAKPSDLVIVANIIHLLPDKEAFAVKAASLVSEGGKLLVIDWLPQDTLIGPPLRLRLTEEKVISYFEKAGLRLACSVDTGWQHFGLVFDHIGDGCGWKNR
jgi:ubiquinone/menaquinone biosynthesis C-methylase UbiE